MNLVGILLGAHLDSSIEYPILKSFPEITNKTKYQCKLFNRAITSNIVESKTNANKINSCCIYDPPDSPKLHTNL